MKEFIKNELSGWKKIEVFWLVLACGVITGLSVYWGDTLMGIISSITGVACVVCAGKDKLSAYTFGLINSVLYAIIAYNSHLYGETIIVTGSLFGAYLLGTKVGSKTTDLKLELGLSRVFAAKPELETLMLETIDELTKK